MKYKCDVCGGWHEHEKFILGSPIDYECKNPNVIYQEK